MQKLILYIVTVLILIQITPLQAESQSVLDSLLTRLENLENKQQQQEAEKAKAEKKAKLKRLLEEAKSKKKAEEPAVAKKFHSGLRQQSALNPNISLGGDFFATYGTSETEYNRVPSEVSMGSGTFDLRELELGIESTLDPYSRGKVFLSFGREGVSLEEGYVEWLNGPFGMNIKAGEFKTQFGQLNRYHDHALPQFVRPLVLINYFGLTSLKGFGIGANFLLPSMIAHVNTLDLQVVNGGVDQSFTSAGKQNLIYVGHLKNYYDLNRSTYFEVGFSGAYGYNDAAETLASRIGGIDLTLKWSPPGRQKYKMLEWRTEALVSSREMPSQTEETWGAFSSLQYRLTAKTLASIRLDYSQLPWNANLEEKGFAVTYDYWQSEFVFMRFQYTYIDRNFDESDNRFTIQTCWAMGPHKHEAY